MGRLDDLKAELVAGHPNTGAYSSTNATAAVEINVVNRTRNRTTMTASEVLNAVDVAEFTALTDTEEEQFWRLMAIGELNPFGVEATILTSIFGGGSTTISTLATLRKENVSRAQELNLGRVEEGTIEQARAL